VAGRETIEHPRRAIQRDLDWSIADGSPGRNCSR